jgi:hypothetical protein
MRRKLAYAIAVLAVGAVTTVVSAQRQETNTAPAHGRYLPEYTKEGDLILPKNSIGRASNDSSAASS